MSRNEPLDPDNPRKELYEAMAADEASLDRKRRRALEIARAHLGVENGHVERIEDGGDTHEVVASVGPGDVIPTGTALDATKTYCRLTVEDDTPLAVSDAEAQGYGDDPAYRSTGLACYLGAPIRVEGSTYGTVCFVDREARTETFGAGERALVELLARLLGREHEARRHRRELDERERALERAEREYDTLVATAPDAVLLFDAETREVVRANRNASDLTGYPEERLVGASQTDLHPPEAGERHRRALDRAVRADDPMARFEDGSPLLVRRRDGTDVPVEVSANDVAVDGREFVLAVLRDVTDRRERQRELRTKTRAIDEASVGVTIADARDPDLPLVYANREFERVTGYDRSEAVGRNCRFLQGPETDEAAVDRIRDAIGDRRPVVTELLNYRADGTPFWNELTLAPVEGPAGGTTHFVGVQRDVTDRKRRNRLLDVLNRVFRHNLRNDLQVIRGCAREIADRVNGDAGDLAGTVLDTAEDLATLGEKARQLEATTKRDGDGVPRPVDDVVKSAADDVDHRFPDADVGVDRLDEETYVPARLGTAVEELVENAVLHGGPDPTVSVRPCRRHRSGAPSDCVRVRVSDDGPGLPDIERCVLEQGYETELEHGNGIGLWLVNWIVTDVGGSLDISTDDGTTVTIHVTTTDDPDGDPSVWSARTPVGTDRQ